MRLGYSHIPALRGGRGPGFNEAEAHAPRIQKKSRQLRRGLSASMRPRRMRLGYLDFLARHCGRSHGFNEAEAHAPRIRMDLEFIHASLRRLQ